MDLQRTFLCERLKYLKRSLDGMFPRTGSSYKGHRQIPQQSPFCIVLIILLCNLGCKVQLQTDCSLFSLN